MGYYTSSMRGLRPFNFSFTPATLDRTQSSFEEFITSIYSLRKYNRLSDPILGSESLLSSLGRNHHLRHGLWLFFYAGFAAVPFLLHPGDSWCTQTSIEDLIILCHIPWKYYRLTDPLLGSISLLSLLGRNHHPCHVLLHLFRAGFAAVQFILHFNDSGSTQSGYEHLITFSYYFWTCSRLSDLFWTLYVFSVHLAVTMILVMCCHTSSMRDLRPFIFSCTLATLDVINHHLKIWCYQVK